MNVLIDANLPAALLFGDRLPLILELLQQYDCVELHRERLYIID